MVSIVFMREFPGDGSFMALMFERTWRHVGMELFCLMLLPPLVFEVFRYQALVLPATMFEMSRVPHPAPFSATVLLLFDAQPNLRLQSIYLPTPCTLVRKELFPEASQCDCGLTITAATPAIRAKTSNKDDKGVIKYRSYIVQCFDAEFGIY